jgi:putative heme-binding domain-containing protein
VIALDQMDNGNLTQDQVTPLLNTDDPGLQKTALAIISTRPGWAKETIGLLGRWLQEKEVPADRQDSLRGALLAFCKDPAIQQLVTQTLQQEQTPAGTRLLLLETMARAPLNQLPAAWVEQLGKGLQHADERVVRQAVATIRAGRAGQFDDVLVGLAQDNTRPAELRVAALTAAAPRLTKLDQALFSYLLGRLDKELGPLARLDAASCLGQARLNEGQLESLTQAIAAASPLEMPHLVGPFERCKNAGVGLKLLAALDKSPGLTSLAPDELRRILQGYPAEVREAAAPLLKKLEVDGEKIKARVAELEPGLTGGDAKRGREVFYGKKAACFTCHTVKGDGGQVGPDLSTIGAIRSERDLLVALAFPSAGFTRGFEPYVVGTRDGKVFPAGILRRETADAVYLVTGDRAEVRVPRTEIDVFEPGKVSIMPQGLDVQLGKQELADLMAFLRSLR